MNWLQKVSYNANIGYLNQYLRHGFDAYDYSYRVPDFLESKGIEFDEDREPYEIGEAWIEKASEKDIDEFREWIQDYRNFLDIGPEAPTYEYLDYNRFVKPTWLIHFTNEPWEIAQKGFIYGHEDMTTLGLTTHFTDESRKKYPGYNFAFSLSRGGRGLMMAARDERGWGGKYGTHAVIFWGAGVEAYHGGDSEDQVIFWGPSIDPDMIFPMYRDQYSGEWQALSEGEERVLKQGDFGEVAQWIVDNHRMMADIRNKYRGYK